MLKQKPWVAICCIALVAVIALVATISAKNGAQNELNNVRTTSAQDLENAKAAASDAAAKAAEELASVKAEAEAAAQAAADELAAVRADAETAAKAAADELAAAKDAAAAELETAKAAAAEALAASQAETAAAAQAAADLESAYADTAAALNAAKEEAAAQAAQAATALENAKAEAEAAVNAVKEAAAAELEAAKAEAEAALNAAKDEATTRAAQAQTDLENVKGEAEAALNAAKEEAAAQAAAALEAVKTEAEAALNAAKEEAAKAADELAAFKTEAAEAAAKAAEELAAVKAEAAEAAAKAAEELANVKNEAAEAAAKAAEELAAAKDAAAAAAAKAAEELENAKAGTAEAEKAAQELAAAKEAAEAAAKEAADALETAKAEAESAAKEAADALEAAKAEAEAAKEQAAAAAAKAAEELAAAKAEAEAAAAAAVAAAVTGTEDDKQGSTEIAEADADLPVAYIMYADGSWANQYWYDGNEYSVTVKNAAIQGAGEYTVGLEFNEAAEGLAFAALGIDQGELKLPGYTIEIKEIRVNGAAIPFEKGYTSSDDGITTRMNIYNEWVGEVPADARSFDGSVDGVKPIIVDKELFAAVKNVEIDFVLHQYPQDIAYIMYADGAWANQYWYDGNEYPVTAKNAVIDGFGDYTVGLEFNEEAQGLAFAALGIVNGEKTYPGAYLKINAIRVNGEEIAFEKGYTSSDDGVTTRMNVYNEWVSEVPADARSFDGVTEDAKPIIVDKEAFAAVKAVEIDFSLLPVTDVAYFMFADASWANQYWYDGNEYPGKVTTAEITGAGTYTVGIELENEAQGLAFAAVGIAKGEQTFNGYFIDVKEIKVDGQPIELGKGYTSSDDGVTTRENVYNEWVGEIPADARRADGDLEGVSAIIVDKEAFVAYKSIEVTFDFIYGKPIEKSADAPLTEDEINAIKAGQYNAYIGIQTEKYTFRNEWNEANYGRDSEAFPGYFDRLTGWDADSNAVDYGGTFVDALIDRNGEYTVSLTTGDMGFAADDTKIRMLFVSTEIPGRAISDGIIEISDVKVKFGDGRTQEYTNVGGETYARITLLDEYNLSDEPVAYTMPIAPNTTITITFTVSGMAE